MESDEKDRWGREAAFFDQIADAKIAGLQPLPEITLERYRTRRRRLFAPEYRFRVVDPLLNRRVLDVGCGEGDTSVLLARLGATVTGIDVSPGAVRVARQRASTSGVGDRTTFVCSPLEQAELPLKSFDIIWCEAFLHHVLDELPDMLEKFKQWCAPTGVILISEPVNLSPALRRLRLALLPAPKATPDERPLTADEVQLIRSHLRNASVRYFDFFGRLDRLVLVDDFYEGASWPRRAVSYALHSLDSILFSLPTTRRLASVVVVSGSP
jgi:2-polyprenyl-3-methyl-5-hydroxy-6-metoxy-1,4-benzoquinol methylase